MQNVYFALLNIYCQCQLNFSAGHNMTHRAYLIAKGVRVSMLLREASMFERCKYQADADIAHDMPA